MNFYQRHIGDYLKATSHLSLLEHGIYTRLLDVYYTREGAIPADQAARLVGARSKEEKAALEAVLSEFFSLEADGWHQKRCDKELAKYKEKSAKAAESAAARWSKTQSDGNADGMRTHSEGNANHKPITNNQEPNKDKPPPAARTSAPKKTAMPADFGISDRVRAWAQENKHGNLDRHLAAFRISCQAKGYAYVDWDAAFMNAIRNNWAKLEPSPQQVARKPDRFELANLEYEKKYGTPETVKALAAKLTGVTA